MKTIIRDLKVKLTEEEWANASDLLAQEDAAARATDIERKQVMLSFKQRLEAHNTQSGILAEKVRTHEETRAVECEWRPDERRLVMELFRLDTGVLIDTRPMTAAERQVTLPGVSAGEN